MFILRKISGDGIQMNFDLGKSYTLLTEEQNPKDFKSLKDKTVYSNDDCIYGFVCEEGGKEHQLSSSQKSYIMTSDGKTFANVSKK